MNRRAVGVACALLTIYLLPPRSVADDGLWIAGLSIRPGVTRGWIAAHIDSSYTLRDVSPTIVAIDRRSKSHEWLGAGVVMAGDTVESVELNWIHTDAPDSKRAADAIVGLLSNLAHNGCDTLEIHASQGTLPTILMQQVELTCGAKTVKIILMNDVVQVTEVLHR